MLCLCAALIALSACYDPDECKTSAVSPDGRYAALITAQNEVQILDLAGGGPLRVLTKTAGEGLGWSPDSSRLAYIDRPTNAPSSLMMIDLAGNAPVTVVRGPAWKSSPVWLDAGRLAFLSHGAADPVGIWSCDLAGGDPRPLFRRGRDISRLWGVPGAGRLVYQSEGELWSLRHADSQTFPLTRNQSGAAVGNNDVALTADGTEAAWCTLAGGRIELAWSHTATTETLAALPLPRRAEGVAMMRDGRVAAGQAERTLFWRPHGLWFQPALSYASWNAVPLRVLGHLGGDGAVYMLNDNIVLAAETARRPAAGRLRARNVEDLLALAYRLARGGYFNSARDLLEGLGERVAEGSRNDYLVAMAWSQLERLQGRPRLGDTWLGRAVRSAVPGSPEEDAAWLERLAQAALEARDRPRANWIMSKMPASLDERPLVTWLRRALENPAANRGWIDIASAFRAGNDDLVAHQVYLAIETAAPEPIALSGVALLIGGDFEPLGDVGDYGQRRLQALLDKPEFQIALLRIMQRKLKGGPEPAELATLLLDQWVRQGDFSSARELVRTALRDSSEAITEYLEMMRRFLVIEEIDRWLQRTVTDVLLQKDIADTIAGRLNTPEDRLTLRLAQVKKALMHGDTDQAKQAWTQAAELEQQLGAADGEEDLFERAQAPFLLRLFQAKIAERERHWADAVKAYAACTALMEATPGSWEVSPFDVALMNELLRTGAAEDPDLLRSYLEIMRGTGDPLINPSHNATSIDVGLSNLATLRRMAPDRWIQPYLVYSEALAYSLRRDSWRALGLLERARALNPPPALRQRILLEEGANRDTLGQSMLAARNYRQLFAAAAAPPQRASAIQAALQAEAASGSLPNPAAWLKEILQSNPLPQPWQAWLARQLGE